jgi:hypothetical protein
MKILFSFKIFSAKDAPGLKIVPEPQINQSAPYS